MSASAIDYGVRAGDLVVPTRVFHSFLVVFGDQEARDELRAAAERRELVGWTWLGEECRCPVTMELGADGARADFEAEGRTFAFQRWLSNLAGDARDAAGEDHLLNSPAEREAVAAAVLALLDEVDGMASAGAARGAGQLELFRVGRA